MSTPADRATPDRTGPDRTGLGPERAEPAAAPPASAPAPRRAADGYRPGRTLPLRVELIRQLKRRRTLVMGAVLVALPFVLLLAFRLGGGPRGNPDRVSLMDTATVSGANFAAVNLFAAAGFLLVVPVALFCGDTVASEANWSSLRYLLAAPVPRARLLWSKLVVALGLSAAAIALLPLTALAVGTAAYGWGPLRLPTGGALAADTAVARLALAAAYVFVSQLVTAALAFWLSTRTDAPLGAVGGAVGLTIIGNVLDEVTALGDWRELLPAHWQYAWLDALAPRLETAGMLQGASLSLSCALVLTALAFRGFARKDVVS
ncbi:ABC transporter permease [Streptomyces tagetis]|uniref:ABC transporter permease n=1 Tax=Streptomyces tagetis TaxID=2820809 RepID=A0A940XQE8_9ACTN|nr:ABC transporter permease [Streptomyces sp. RG38]MBQ0829175.1 ABC transporter permease [Streptomyces sp. RG38]